MSDKPPLKTTGVTALDVKFNTEANLLYAAFGVNPNLWVVDDVGTPNAFASPEISLSGYTGTVYIGVTLVRDYLWRMELGEIAVAGVMAHEFAHILQNQSTSTLRWKYRELHADFLAGYYMARRSYLVDADIRGFFLAMYGLGDSDYWSPLHHGTPDERLQASLAGYERGHLSLSEAYRAGNAYVKKKQLSEVSR